MPGKIEGYQGIKPHRLEYVVYLQILRYILDYISFASVNAKEFDISYSKISLEGVP